MFRYEVNVMYSQEQSQLGMQYGRLNIMARNPNDALDQVAYVLGGLGKAGTYVLFAYWNSKRGYVNKGSGRVVVDSRNDWRWDEKKVDEEP